MGVEGKDKARDGAGADGVGANERAEGGAAGKGAGSPEAGVAGPPPAKDRDAAGGSGAAARQGHDTARAADHGTSPAPADEGAGITDPDALMDLYYEVSMEGVDLRRFLDRLDAGEWGPVAPEAVVDFLRQLEAVILSNVEVKAMEGPHYAGRRAEVVEETQREFEELVARYLDRL
ncbi:hypothetical protein Tmar_1379 [Thermaerobacter marianensis DSM 12885]|uniref:Uncharacterized protein n=1 Tax=Thermaerobacter marianensis (strain ATCC 700841 / DSM 12885 / JCM 10246 / 7p75a) TaxID=644966 RepID=E6SMD3_THEM7|nr:hypothetical protein [Thermaerobacter marianensis]ADU51492.1 hypothetical protein Tmar_1379 [Thermaerobacter marianensis DSM 12885]